MLKIFSLIIATSLLASCSSRFETIYKNPPAKYEKLGRVSGSASGSMGILIAPLYAIPMGINSRISRAYQDALSQAPGATSLIDITYEESWHWWFIGTGRTVTISGEAIKEIK